MDRQGVTNTITQILTDKLDIVVADVSDTTTFAALGADSVDRVEIVLAIEEAFGIELSDEDLESIVTVGQAIDKVLELAK